MIDAFRGTDAVADWTAALTFVTLVLAVVTAVVAHFADRRVVEAAGREQASLERSQRAFLAAFPSEAVVDWTPSRGPDCTIRLSVKNFGALPATEVTADFAIQEAAIEDFFVEFDPHRQMETRVDMGVIVPGEEAQCTQVMKARQSLPFPRTLSLEGRISFKDGFGHPRCCTFGYTFRGDDFEVTQPGGNHYRCPGSRAIRMRGYFSAT